MRSKLFIKWVFSLVSGYSCNKFRDILLLLNLLLFNHTTSSISSTSDLILSTLNSTLVITLIASTYWPRFTLIYFKSSILLQWQWYIVNRFVVVSVKNFVLSTVTCVVFYCTTPSCRQIYRILVSSLVHNLSI